MKFKREFFFNYSSIFFLIWNGFKCLVWKFVIYAFIHFAGQRNDLSAPLCTQTTISSILYFKFTAIRCTSTENNKKQTSFYTDIICRQIQFNGNRILLSETGCNSIERFSFLYMNLLIHLEFHRAENTARMRFLTKSTQLFANTAFCYWK